MTNEDKKLVEESVSDFLPTGYNVPKGPSNYMKFEQGANAFRVLSSAVTGWEWWIDGEKGRTPVRIKPDGKVPAGVDPEIIKHFWAFVVWNYQTNTVQILEITQKGIMKYITSLVKSKSWGSPKGYDLVVTKEGEGLNTKYVANADPPKELDPKIDESFKKMSINLEALFTGADPFKTA